MNKIKYFLILLVICSATLLFRTKSNADDFEQTNKIISDLRDSTADIFFILGNNYFYGRGFTQNYKKAAEAYVSAANRGHSGAQSNLGVLFAKGLGVSKDDKEAIRWYTLAAEQGNSTAQNNLGWMFENGRGVSLNYIQAHMWYNVAARDITNKIALKNRQNISEKMTTEQVNKAQEDAEKCIEQNFKSCDF